MKYLVAQGKKVALLNFNASQLAYLTVAPTNSLLDEQG